MPTTTFSSQEFNHDVSRAQKAAHSGPVIITDHGRPAHVLLSIDDYHQLTHNQLSIVDLLAMPEADTNIDFEPPRLNGKLYQPADLS